jgi:hypothetical protein
MRATPGLPKAVVALTEKPLIRGVQPKSESDNTSSLLLPTLIRPRRYRCRVAPAQHRRRRLHCRSRHRQHRRTDRRRSAHSSNCSSSPSSSTAKPCRRIAGVPALSSPPSLPLRPMETGEQECRDRAGVRPWGARYRAGEGCKGCKGCKGSERQTRRELREIWKVVMHAFSPFAR